MNRHSPENPAPDHQPSPETAEQQRFEARVQEAVQAAYREVALETDDPNPQEIFWKPYCQQFSQSLYARLAPLKAEPKYVRINKIPKDSPSNLRHHIFLAIKAPDGKDFFVDGTWQQLIDTPNKKTGLMFERADRLPESLTAKSAPREIREIWDTGLCMLEAKRLIAKANPALKLKVKQTVCNELKIDERDFEYFINLVSNFTPDRSKQILEAIKKQTR